MSIVIVLVIVVGLTLLTAVYVAAEFAAVSVRRSRIRQLAEDGHPLALRLRPFIEDARELDRYIAASQIGITLTSLVLGAYGQAAIAPPLAAAIAAWSRDPQWSFSVASISVLVLLTVFNVIVGELIPKTVALQRPTYTALATVLPMQWSLIVYGPFIKFLNGSGLLFLKLLGIHQTGHRHIHSPEELELLIAESRDGGLLEPDEHRRLQRALRLRLRTARELMVPWASVEVVDVQTRISDVFDALARSSFTRLPVYRGARDIVAGILNTKKLALRRLQGSPPQSIAEMLQPAVTTPPTASGDRLLALFQARKTHHAIVIDEAGRALGLVTLEDVLRAFLGEMPDDLKTKFGRRAGETPAVAGRAGHG
jgi:CBS domain containing-hemolysin-like protein